MSILVTGGRGNTASPLSALLNDAKVPFVVASRSKDPSSTYQQAHFDWQDESTYGTLLKSTPIKAAYLVGPPSNDFVGRTKAFIDIARRHGVKRFVLLSGSPVEAGGPGQGQVHEYLMTLGVEYTVLRPSWFQQNMTEHTTRLNPKESFQIYSATGEGKIPWVSTHDIAAVAFRALVDEKPHNTDYIILGPELLSYADVANIISEETGRNFEHANVSEKEMTKRFRQGGIPDEWAKVLSMLDVMVANGGEERLNDVVERITGRPPRKFRTFVKEKRDKFV